MKSFPVKQQDKSATNGFSATAESKLKEYMYIGGMPEAVSAYVETGALHEARKVQEKILNNYKNDFTRHIKGTDIPKVRMIWYSGNLKAQ